MKVVQSEKNFIKSLNDKHNAYKMPQELSNVPLPVLKHLSLKTHLKYGTPESMQFSAAGVPDFLVVKEAPRDYYFVEVKSEHDNLKLSQVKWIKRWRDSFEIKLARRQNKKSQWDEISSQEMRLTRK